MTPNTSPSPVITPEPMTLHASDGFALQAVRYPAVGQVRAHLVVAGATGVPQLFYRNFAQFAARQGYTVLTVDYRGIGLSKPASLRGFRMNYLDWAFQDVRAAVDAMASDSVPLFMVGHSFGGHAFGLLPNHQRVGRFYTFATGAGWHGRLPQCAGRARRHRACHTRYRSHRASGLLSPPGPSFVGKRAAMVCRASAA